MKTAGFPVAHHVAVMAVVMRQMVAAFPAWAMRGIPVRWRMEGSRRWAAVMPATIVVVLANVFVMMLVRTPLVSLRMVMAAFMAVFPPVVISQGI